MSNADSMTSNVDMDSETDACRLDGGEDADRSHLEGVEDGCGCTEIWEHLSEQRDG